MENPSIGSNQSNIFIFHHTTIISISAQSPISGTVISQKQTHDDFSFVRSEQNVKVCNNLYLCGFLRRLKFSRYFAHLFLFLAFIPEKNQMIDI
jgi:hypothetical protein